MIKTSSERTSYCAQCETWAKEASDLRQLLATERDEFGAKEIKLLAVARLAGEYATFPSSHNRTNLKTAIAALRSTLFGIPIKTDPNLKPGEWRLEK